MFENVLKQIGILKPFFISKNRGKSLKSEKSYINAILPYFYIFVIKWIFLLIQKVKFCSFFQRDMRDA